MPAQSSKRRNTCIRKLKLIIPLLLFSFFGYTQTLTGLWTGVISNDSNTVRKDQSFEIALTEYKGKVYGYSRSEFIVDDVLYYIVKRVKGTIDGDICEVIDDDIIAYNFNGKLDKGVKVTSTFKRDKTDSTWHLVGTWKTNQTKKYYAVTGKVSLDEEKDLTASKIFPHLEELKLANDVAFYRERKTEPPVVKIAQPDKTNIIIAPASADIAANKPDQTPVVSPEPEYDPVKTKSEPPVTVSKTASAQNNKRPGISNNSVASSAEVKRLNTDDITTIKKTEPVVAKTAPAIASNQPETKTVNNQPEIKIQQEKVIAASNPDARPVTNNSKPETRPQTTMAVNKPVIESPANNKSTTSIKTNNIPPSTSVSKPVTTSTSAASNQKINVVSDVSKASANVSTSQPPIVTTTAPQKQMDAQPVVIAPIPPVTTTVAERNGAAEDINGRKTEVSQVVNFKSDSLLLALYDNGQVDGDTVSVLMNGQVLMPRQGLKASAIRKTIYLTPGKDDEFSLVLYAENLGTYPPNTGLLVVHDGEDVYNLRFSSDFKKNTGIIFRRKK